MSEQPLSLTIRGARGSAPTPGPQTLRYGGHTTCLQLAFSPRHHLLLDCGSGLRTLHDDLPADPGSEGLRFEVFLTHFHNDHLEGLQLFRPLYDASSEFVFRGRRCEQASLQEAVERSMVPPRFPLALCDTASQKSYFEPGDDPQWVEGVEVARCALFHPQGAVGYRLRRAERSVVFFTDSEPGDEATERGKLELARGADVLIHDAQYTPAEYEKYRGWGHSSWRHAVQLAERADVGRLVLFHHDPDRTDDEVGRIVEEARREFAGTEAAHEGMSFPL